MAQGTEMMGFRVRTETKEAIEAAAKEAGTTVADYLRNLVEGAMAGRPTSSSGGDVGEELRQLRRDLAAAVEALGALTCRIKAVKDDGLVAETEKNFRKWVNEKLRRA